MAIRVSESRVTIWPQQFDFWTIPPEQLHFDEDVRIPTPFSKIMEKIEWVISWDIENGLGDKIHEVRLSPKWAFALLAEIPSLVDSILPETGLIWEDIRFETIQKGMRIPVRIDEGLEHLVATVDINWNVI